MLVARLFSKIYKKGGIVLIDHTGQKFICGNPINKEKPLTLKILNKKLNWKFLINPDLSFPEAYMNGEVVIENGSLLDFLNMTFENLGRQEINTSGYLFKKILHTWRFFTNYNFPGKSKKNVQHHYDIGEDLYDLFLDKSRQYSCAYWKSSDETLEDAQKNKINHIIKKLNLSPGQTVLDIGSGWGSMCFEIASQSECEVTGYTLSKNQYEYCVNKAKELKLDNQCHFELSDYREIKGKFNRIVSVGMLEHVGRKFYKTFFKKINDLMTDDGLSLIHTIGSVDPKGPPQPFINKYIFPGGIVPSGSDLIDSVEKTGLILSDMESLILHYDKTLEAWLERFLKNREKAKRMYSEKFCKMWEFYLASCSAAFKYRDLLVYQLQLVKDFQSLPNNRRDYIYS